MKPAILTIRRAQHAIAMIVIGGLLIPLATAVAAEPSMRVLIRAAKPYDRVVSEIHARGGRVTQRYQHFDGIAADIPVSSIGSLRTFVGTDRMSKDENVWLAHQKNAARILQSNSLAESPGPRARRIASAGATRRIPTDDTRVNVGALHGAGYKGQGIIVAVIDTGLRPGYPHLEADGSIIGGEDLVGDGRGYSHPDNDWHGTVVAGMISGDVVLEFAPGNLFLESMAAYSPQSIIDGNKVALVGSAPASSIYMLRAFDPERNGFGSQALAAMDRVIELKRRYLEGKPGGLNIQVCNMSYVVSELVPGQGMVSQAANEMMNVGIIPVVAGGNDGPSSMTIAAPATASEALAVGAASLTYSDRVYASMLFGSVAAGAAYRPSVADQSAFFSSRGPLRDGRTHPDVIANGLTVMSQGYGPPDSVAFAAGTSFAAPTVAGVAAVLLQKHSWASPRQIRNAIILTANPNVLGDGSTELDQGEGFADAFAASRLLSTHWVPSSSEKPRRPRNSVEHNIERRTSLEVMRGNVALKTGALRPAQRFEILYEVEPGTSDVRIELNNFSNAVPPNQQNPFFGDDMLLAVYPAANVIAGNGNDLGVGYDIFQFTRGGVFVNPFGETGVMRIALNGSWTNAASVSGDVHISSTKSPVVAPTARGRIRNGQTVSIPVKVKPGARRADFVLSWRNNWSQLRVSDIDLYVVAPDGSTNFDGASLRSPERAGIENPQAGIWTIRVDGFEVPAGMDSYELNAYVDGKPVQ